MSTGSSKIVVLLVVIALATGVTHLLSKAQLFGLGLPESQTVTTCSGARIELDGMRAELLRSHNEERSDYGVPALCWNEKLASVVTSHSEYMMERGFYAHDTPEGIELSDRTLAAGYESQFVTENIHRTYLSSGYRPNMRDMEKVVQDWMESPDHRRNLLDPRLREVGIGVNYGHFGYKTDRSGTYTVDFGTPVD